MLTSFGRYAAPDLTFRKPRNHKITKNDIIHFTNDLSYEVFGYTLHGTRVWQEVDGYIVENILAELSGQTVAAFSNSNSELQLYKNELR